MTVYLITFKAYKKKMNAFQNIIFAMSNCNPSGWKTHANAFLCLFSLYIYCLNIGVGEVKPISLMCIFVVLHNLTIGHVTNRNIIIWRLLPMEYCLLPHILA